MDQLPEQFDEYTCETRRKEWVIKECIEIREPFYSFHAETLDDRNHTIIFYIDIEM